MPEAPSSRISELPLLHTARQLWRATHQLWFLFLLSLSPGLSKSAAALMVIHIHRIVTTQLNAWSLGCSRLERSVKVSSDEAIIIACEFHTLSQNKELNTSISRREAPFPIYNCLMQLLPLLSVLSVLVVGFREIRETTFLQVALFLGLFSALQLTKFSITLYRGSPGHLI